jgi:hypothetical protein
LKPAASAVVHDELSARLNIASMVVRSSLAPGDASSPTRLQTPARCDLDDVGATAFGRDVPKIDSAVTTASPAL